MLSISDSTLLCMVVSSVTGGNVSYKGLAEDLISDYHLFESVAKNDESKGTSKVVDKYIKDTDIPRVLQYDTSLILGGLDMWAIERSRGMVVKYGKGQHE